MAITAALVKELRQRTGAGMMECKKALVETDGNIELAIENMRKSGQVKAAKKAGRIAAEGLIVIQSSEDGRQVAMAEINCETDFVAKDQHFVSFAQSVVNQALHSDVSNVDALSQLPIQSDESTTIEEARQALVAKIGENITVRRFVRLSSEQPIAVYLHGTRIGVLVDMSGGDAELGKDMAMHIAAINPLCVSEQDVPEDVLAKEKEIISAQAAESGKPANIIEKMVQGRLKKFLSEVTLLNQAFVKDPDIKVGRLLDQKGARINQFVRFEVGEGIEKKKENFAEEVKAQMR